MFLLITIKRPRNPEHPSALKCRHENWWAEHCAEMGCPNYVNNCKRHGLVGEVGEKCSRAKTTGACPLTNEICTDQTGEHHTGLYTEYDSIDAAEIDFKNLGYHVTRIEEAKIPDGWKLVQEYDADSV